MSYTRLGPVSGLGARGATANCVGGERDAQGEFCCSDGDWSNLTYLKIKGADSLRYHNEKRVRHALSLLLPTGVGDFAHDQNARGDDRLQRSVARAAINFNALYPATRWAKIPCQVPSPSGCADCYSVWKPLGTPSSGAVQAALDDMGVSNSFVRSTADENRVVSTVPKSQATFQRRDMPVRSDLLQINDGVVAPRPWLKDFLDVFAPGWRGIDTASLASQLKRVVFKPGDRTETGGEEAPPPTDPASVEEGLSPVWIGVAALALVGVAGAGFYVMRK